MRLSAVFRIRLRLALVTTLALLTLVAAVLFAASCLAPGSALGRALPLSSASETRADVLMTAGSAASGAEIRRDTLRTLTLSPAAASAWLRLAWLADKAGDDAARNAALERSYTLAPLGPDVTAWRLGFVFDRWGRLTPSLRQQALAELRAARRSRPSVVDSVRSTVTDPTGALALRLTLTVD